MNDNNATTKKDECLFDQAILDQTKTDFDLVTQEDVQLAALSLAKQSRRNLKIFTHDLEQAVYDNNAFVKSVARLARLHRSTFVHILIQDSEPAAKRGHLLIQEAHRFTDKVIIRRTSKDYTDLTKCFLLADDTGILLRKHWDSFEGKLLFHRGPEVIKYLNLFSRAWDASEPELEFRRLGL